MKHKQNLYLMITILWCVMIFWFSAQNGTSSGGMSDRILQWIGNLIQVDLMQLDVIHWLQLIIRKSAHAFVYFMLAIWMYLYFQYTNHKNYARLLAILGCFLYACSDEFHQLFIAGRAGQFQDVIINMCGTMLAMVIFPCFYRWVKKRVFCENTQ